jgi:type I restriction enzyme M protein
MISKMKPVEQGGSRIAIVFNGSPLFTGGAGSGESEIRRWIIENDWLEAVVALPDQLFYNTGISTYFWVVTNRKAPHRRGKVQLVDARSRWAKMRKSLGEKRKYLTADHIAEITQLYGAFEENEQVKIFPNEAFGFLRITVERPLRQRWEVSDDTLAAVQSDRKLARLDAADLEALVTALEAHSGLTTSDWAVLVDKLTPAIVGLGLTKPQTRALWHALAVSDPEAPLVTDKKDNPQPDPDLRDSENVPLPSEPVSYEADPTSRIDTKTYRQAIDDYMGTEVSSYVEDAWVDRGKTRIGYEIPFTRLFYTYTPPRSLEDIDAEIKLLEAEIQELLDEVTE